MAEKKDSASKAKTATKKPASKPAAEKKATPVKKEVKEVKTEVVAEEVPAKKVVAEVKAEKLPIAIGIKKVALVSVKTSDIKPLADFDWDRIGKYEDTYSPAEKKSMQEVYDETLKSIAEQEVLMGTVVAKTNREVVINIGYKSEGVVSISEFRYNPDLKAGDQVEVFVVNPEDKSGQLILSHARARSLKAWDRVNDVLASQEIIKGYVKCRTKGGLIVDVFGIEAFLPGSQIDVKPIRDYDVYVDKTMEFKVVKINKEFKNIVVDRKSVV